MKYHLFFEQSGTWRDVLRSHGHTAIDYDIVNEYGKTDRKIDLFAEIEREYAFVTGTWSPPMGDARQTVFTKMRPDRDFIIAFFPCTYFTDLNELQFKGYGYKGHKFGSVHDTTCAEMILQIHARADEQLRHYKLFNKLCFVCQELKIPLIVENPRGAHDRNYVKDYSPFRPAWCDADRSLFGDDKVKATLYWAINFEMREQFQMFVQVAKTKRVQRLRGKERSEMTPEYADNFYKRFLAGVGVQCGKTMKTHYMTFVKEREKETPAEYSPCENCERDCTTSCRHHCDHEGE